VIHLFIPLS
jgi:hypothetical protein